MPADPAGERLPGHPQALRMLAALHERPINFDPSELAHGPGWHKDDYCQPLPDEPPGPPIEDGSWSAACRLMRDYEFADPRIIRAAYEDRSSLVNRNMLLEGRFLLLRFHFGVRVSAVRDEQELIAGRPVRVFGWSYRTLQGHLEMGQMDYEVCKWLDTGGVDFRIHVLSRAAPIPNPVLRVGFRVFGRHMQKKFARRACARMAELVAAELATPGRGAATAGVASAADAIRVRA